MPDTNTTTHRVEQDHHEGRGRGHVTKVTVNNRPVRLTGDRVTGLEIKQAAIAQGVAIQLDFVLSMRLERGGSRIVGDTDQVKVEDHARFTAVAGDDNS